MSQSLSFGVNLGGDAGEVRERARWAEDAGFDVVTAADHLGLVSPLLMLAVAAEVTTRVRLRPYVLDHGFWNPALLARDVATLDVLSGGRVEVGLGAGWVPAEHAEAGLPFPPYAQRLADLDAFAAQLRARLDDPGHVPAPVQRPVPLMIASMSQRGLRVAARYGDVVALSGARQPAGRPGTLTLVSAQQTDDAVALVGQVRSEAGLPPAVLDALLQQVVVDGDPQEVADRWAAEDDAPFTAADVLASPFVLLASSVEEAADELVRRAERWGITSWCTHPGSGEALAAVVAHVRAASATLEP